MRRKLEEILCDAKCASAEDIQLLIDELGNFKESLIGILADKMYDPDPNEPFWQK